MDLTDTLCAAAIRLARTDRQVRQHVDGWASEGIDNTALAALAVTLLRSPNLNPLEVAAALEARDFNKVRRGIPKRAKHEPPPLMAHQQIGVDWLGERVTAILADEMGLGKSLQALEATQRLDAEALIVCPAALTASWKAEIARWYPAAKVKILTAKHHALDPKARYHVVSYDTAKQPGLVRRAITLRRWPVAILDEAHRSKNTSSARSKAMGLLEWDRLWLLTGTPIRNRPIDLFGLLRLMRHPLSENRAEYVRRYCGLTELDADGSTPLGVAVADVVLRRRKSECLDLPAKTRVEVRLTSPELQPFDDIRQMMRARHELAKAKAPATADAAIDIASDAKCLVFSGYIEPLNVIEERLKRQGIGTARIDGSIGPQQRLAQTQRFQTDPSCRVLLGQIDAAGEGLNLYEATYVVFNDLALVPAQHAQAEDRAHRIGQCRPLTVLYQVADCDLDRYVGDMLAAKLQTIADFDAGAGVTPERLLAALQQKKPEALLT